jgi:hypothetical protein
MNECRNQLILHLMLECLEATPTGSDVSQILRE